jgi:hypothetical protein
MLFEMQCHWRQDVDPPLCSRKQRPEYGMEISDIASQKEVQKSTIGGKNDVDTYCQFWNTTKRGVQQ